MYMFIVVELEQGLIELCDAWSTSLSFDSTNGYTEKERPEQNPIDPCSAHAEVHARGITCMLRF